MGSSVRERLLEAALTLMKRKGKEPSVTEIAAEAGVKESIIYRHYRDKQDLLFCAWGKEASSFYRDLTENLNGIRDPLSRLGRLMWVWLSLCEKNPWFLHYLFFFCFSQPTFYRHEAYLIFKKGDEIVDDILREGMKAGTFPWDLPVATARDMLLGLLNTECLYVIEGFSQGKAADRFDPCYALITRMLQFGRVHHRQKVDKRRLILETAEKVVAAGAEKQATAALIAREAGLSEGTIYNYFQDKDDLFLSAIRWRLELLTAMVEEFFKRSSPIGKLVRFIFYHFTAYIRYPFAVKTFILKGIFSEKFYHSEAIKDFERYLSTVDEICEEGKREGDFCSEIEQKALKSMLLGVFVKTAQMWFEKGDKVGAEMMGRLNEVTTLLLRAVLADERKFPWMERGAGN
ncbi:MAG TPA: TetR/AcrR family transcriptional regulator [Syntrophales bacterium]|nr:TetR/AcrR family transcriptional regulator [Syntrophales bacterium]HOL60105.1 TetR/AcrR family transcriptional regulator [Syntrophales bacterium]HPO35339.1 TetR/AcrR family transcriptional regulator [Syntrophales bacterium]